MPGVRSWQSQACHHGVADALGHPPHPVCHHGVVDDSYRHPLISAQGADVRPGHGRVCPRACTSIFRQTCLVSQMQSGVDEELIYGQGYSLVEVLQKFGNWHRAGGVGNGQAHAFGTDVTKRFEAPQICGQ